MIDKATLKKIKQNNKKLVKLEQQKGMIPKTIEIFSVNALT